MWSLSTPGTNNAQQLIAHHGLTHSSVVVLCHLYLLLLIYFCYNVVCSVCLSTWPQRLDKTKSCSIKITDCGVCLLHLLAPNDSKQIIFDGDLYWRTRHRIIHSIIIIPIIEFYTYSFPFLWSFEFVNYREHILLYVTVDWYLSLTD